MTRNHYGILLWVVCLVSWAAVWLPVLVHLSMTWYRGRNSLFKQLCPEKIRLYYRYFAPTEKLPQSGELAHHFEQQFARLYGRRRYAIPLTLLVIVSGCGFCATARSIQVWEQVSVLWFGSTPSESLVALPRVAVAGFLGAFTWVVTDQLQRLRSGDLTQHDLAICVLRFLVAIPFGYAFSFWVPDSFGVPLAFLLGTFPTGTLLRSGQRLVAQLLHLAEADARPGVELESLQSVSRSNAERFMEEGVSTIAELANSDPVDLALRTHQPFDYVTDCAAQALIWIYFTDSTKLLTKYSLRSVYEVSWLLDRLDGSDAERRRRAQTTLEEVARVLDLTPQVLRNTLDRIVGLPFTHFLLELGRQRTGLEVTDLERGQRQPESERQVAAQPLPTQAALAG
jgi:hypothetical protein